jgi:hypothetical protein
MHPSGLLTNILSAWNVVASGERKRGITASGNALLVCHRQRSASSQVARGMSVRAGVEEGVPVVCGIVGYVGKQERCVEVLMEGLRRPTYRGYDPAGLALQSVPAA